MPTIQVEILEAKRRLNSTAIVLTARTNNRVITREITGNQFDTWEQLANWLINQEPDFIRLPDKEKSLNITFHTETETDPETGQEQQINILDNVTVL